MLLNKSSSPPPPCSNKVKPKASPYIGVGSSSSSSSFFFFSLKLISIIDGNLWFDYSVCVFLNYLLMNSYYTLSQVQVYNVREIVLSQPLYTSLLLIQDSHDSLILSYSCSFRSFAASVLLSACAMLSACAILQSKLCKVRSTLQRFRLFR